MPGVLSHTLVVVAFSPHIRCTRLIHTKPPAHPSLSDTNVRLLLSGVTANQRRVPDADDMTRSADF
jgi:hypothetical protein